MVRLFLVLGWGNRSRGDDALGPLLIEQLALRLGADLLEWVEFLEDYQLQVEHALDLCERQQVLFVDASVECAGPYAVSQVQARRDASCSTHAMSPQAVLEVYREVQHCDPPACTLLVLRGERFELGEPPRVAARKHLAQALEWALSWVHTILASALATGAGPCLAVNST